MGNLVNPGPQQTTVAIAEKSPEQARHDAIYQWAVEDGNISNTRGDMRLDNFRIQWQERRFESCYRSLKEYMKATTDFDLDRAVEWRTWFESLQNGFVPA